MAQRLSKQRISGLARGGELLDVDIPEKTPWILDGLLPQRRVIMLSSQPGIGKSRFTTAMAVGMATGHGIGIHIPCRSKALILALELSYGDVAQNIQEAVRGFGMTTEEARVRLDENLRVVSKSDSLKGYSAPDLRVMFKRNGAADDSNTRRLIEILKKDKFRPDLIILDSLIEVNTGDENSSTQARGLFNALPGLLRDELGCTVLVLHHQRKPPEDNNRSYNHGERGSSDFKAQVDAVWWLNGDTKVSKVEENGQTLFTKEIKLECGKARKLESWEGQMKFRSVGAPGWSRFEKADSTCVHWWSPTTDDGRREVAWSIRSGIREALSYGIPEDGTPISSTDLRRHSDNPRGLLKKLDGLVRKGILTAVRPGAPRPNTYAIDERHVADAKQLSLDQSESPANPIGPEV